MLFLSPNQKYQSTEGTHTYMTVEHQQEVIAVTRNRVRKSDARTAAPQRSATFDVTHSRRRNFYTLTSNNQMRTSPRQLLRYKFPASVHAVDLLPTDPDMQQWSPSRDI